MSCLEQSLPVIIYFLLVILLIVLIILLIKSIFVIDKVNKIMNNVDEKVNRLEGIFSVIDSATDTFTLISDKLVSLIAGGIGKLFKRKEEDNHEQK